MLNYGKPHEFIERSGSLEEKIDRHESLRLSEDGSSNESPANEVFKYSFRQWLTLGCLAFGNFSIGACVSLQAPFFPAEAEKKGASATEYGFVFGVYQLTMFIFSPVFGKLVAFVTPYFTLNSGVFVVGGSTILFGLLDHSPAGSTFVALAIIVRVVEGLGAVAVKISTYTIISNQFQSNVATAFASMETCLGVGLIIGPTLGGVLYQLGGYPVPFMVCGVLLLVDALVIFFLMPQEDGKFEKSGNLVSFWANPTIVFCSVVVFTSYYFIGVYQTSLEPHLRKFNLTPFWVGVIFIISGGFYSLSAPLWGRWCDRGANPKCITLIGCFLAFLSQMIMGPAAFIPLDTKLWMVILATLFMGIAVGAKQVTSFILCIRNAIERGFPNDVTTYGLVSSMFLSSQSLGAFVGPILGGYFLDTIGFRWSTVILMALETLLMLGIVCHGILISGFKQTEEKERLLVKKRKKSKFESSYSQVIN